MKQLNYKFLIASLTAFLVLIILTLFLLYYFWSNEAIPRGPKLVIDHDGGADDAMAIFMALLYEKYFHGFPVIALTTTHGNVNETQVFINTQKFLGIANRKDVSIYRGCQYPLIKNIPSDYYFGVDGLGDSDSEFLDYEPIEAKPEHAAVALVELSKKFEGELIVVALGALTNIALAVKLDPDFINRLSQLYVAAGNVHDEEYNEPEFNAIMDVESYYVVLNNSRADLVTVIPFSQALKSHNVHRDWRMFTLGSIQTEIMRALNVFEQKSILMSEEWCLLDPIAMAIVLDEYHIAKETRRVHNSIDICEQRGMNINDFTTNETNARLIYKITEEPYKKLLLDIFSADLNGVKK
ncbi:unnamed protein product, partial [Iphiclides podalirius]